MVNVYKEVLPTGIILSFVQLVILQTWGGKGLSGKEVLTSTCSELVANPVWFAGVKHTHPLQPSDL